jgi:hypothetical protein
MKSQCEIEGYDNSAKYLVEEDKTEDKDEGN